ncbi:ATP-binding protein [Caulobacter segnis]
MPRELPARDQLERASTAPRTSWSRPATACAACGPARPATSWPPWPRWSRPCARPARRKPSCTVQGRKTDLHPLVADEIERVVVEALFNAHRHARATRIEVLVDFEPKRLRVSVHDDGVGIDPRVLEAGGRDGHFGLAGMRERARKIHGVLTIRSAPGRGTEIELTAPGGVAYATPRGSVGQLSAGARKRRARA